ncbi:MAG: hypothetical protein H6Q67_1404 [Firmicutes bacterium]|nr:hypothetical protein [Bacillota bacterium]
MALLTGLLDAIGVEMDAWEYKYDLVPLLDVFIAYDISVLPVSYMLIYQHFRTWRSFAIAHVILVLVIAICSIIFSAKFYVFCFRRKINQSSHMA